MLRSRRRSAPSASASANAVAVAETTMPRSYRRSAPSSSRVLAETLTDEEAELDDKTTLFCPRPKTKMGFFYSSAYKEHKKKREEKQKEQLLQLNSDADDNGSQIRLTLDDEIPLKRDLTRRKRNSLRGAAAWKGGSEPTNVTAFLAARIETEKPHVKDRDHIAIHDHGMALPRLWSMEASKGHMMDLTLTGKDGIPVHASRFILASHSPVLEEVFFKNKRSHGHGSININSSGRYELSLDFCTEAVIRAAVHHCFSGELPAEFGAPSPSEDAARSLAQLDRLAREYKLGALGEATYRATRKLINRRAVLACAVFDELSLRGSSQREQQQQMGMAVDGIKRYALDSMREMPMDTLLAGGVQWMKDCAVEAIMIDWDMDVDEFYMFKILKAWTAADEEGRFPVACRLSEHIELKFIEPELLMRQVKHSGFFDEKQIVEAVKLIKDSLANRDPCEMERVLVEGAGTELVNGIYCRVEDALGLSEEEILFVKEADDGVSDVGLYLWGTKWNIAMCLDYSNCFYSCDDPADKSPTELVPTNNWKIQYGSKDPPPYCTYLPNTRKGRLSCTLSEKSTCILAPNLEEMMDPTIAQKRRSGYFDNHTHDVIEKRTLTLQQMMHLPEDREKVGSTYMPISNKPQHQDTAPEPEEVKVEVELLQHQKDVKPTQNVSLQSVLIGGAVYMIVFMIVYADLFNNQIEEVLLCIEPEDGMLFQLNP